MKRRTIFLFLMPLVFISLALVGSYIFQDNLSRFLINPRTPFQAIPAPQAPDYTLKFETDDLKYNTHAWALLPNNSALIEKKTTEPTPKLEIKQTQDKTQAGDSDEALIFYVHGSGYYDKNNWNGPIDDESANQILEQISIPNEIGPFIKIGKIYAPRYRQTTLFARFTHKYDGIAARQLAYRDVRSAFSEFLKNTDPEKPIIMVGYDQGGLYVLGLINEFFQNNKKLRERLTTAYILQFGVAKSVYKDYLTNIPPCEKAIQTGCIVSYFAFEESLKKDITRVRTRSLMIKDADQFITIANDQLTCVNPLSWKMNEEYVGPERHKGAASATGLAFEQSPPILSGAVGAQCSDGVLILDKPNKGFLQNPQWFGSQWRAQPFNLFYRDLHDDIRRRITVHLPVLAENLRQLKPITIDEAIELNDSPINKVPN